MDEPTLLYYAMRVMRGEVLRHASRESCILSTRLLCHVYTELGIPNMPICVGVTAINQSALEDHLAGREAPSEGATGIAVRYTEGDKDPDRDEEDMWFGGHVVAFAKNYLADPSADQLSRPEIGLTIEPMLMAFTDEQAAAFIDGDGSPTVNLPGGGAISYESHSEDTSYYQSPDWLSMNPGDPLYDRILETTLGLVDAARDFDGLPPLPPLPPSYSARDPLTPETMAMALRSARELGTALTPDEEAHVARVLR